jgi:DNA repair protein RecO (recombination protein O)
MLTKAEGIVIRARDYGESHKVIVLYTREFGKIAVMARGVKKTKSRLSFVTQVLTHGQYQFFAGSGMGTLSQGEVIESHHALRQDVLSMSYAAYMAELTDKLTLEKEANPYVFHLLSKTFSYLEEGKDADILCRIFELKMLSVAGYRPQLDQCLHCGEEDKPFYFSVAKGGILCQDCRLPEEPVLSLSPSAARLLRLFLHFDINRIGEIRVKQETKDLLERVMYDYTDYHTDLRLKSRDVLNQMKAFEEHNPRTI